MVGNLPCPNGSYDLNLVSKIWILAGDIRSRSWPNIGDSYGMFVEKLGFIPTIGGKLIVCTVQLTVHVT